MSSTSIFGGSTIFFRLVAAVVLSSLISAFLSALAPRMSRGYSRRRRERSCERWRDARSGRDGLHHPPDLLLRK